jgi:lipid-binding SYLF domain-containing protein
MKRPGRIMRSAVWAVGLSLMASFVLPGVAGAATAQAIDEAANQALVVFKSTVNGADQFIRDAKGYLIFPRVTQAGIEIGGQYGEGVLRIGGRSAGYYSISGGSIGITFGAETKSVILAFMDDQALKQFQAKARADQSWQWGIDGAVALVDVGSQGDVNSATINQPVVAFVYDQSGLFFNLSLQGTKISDLQR